MKRNKTRDKLAFFEEKLSAFYRKHKRLLPWRKKNITPYEVWVSEIFLQQTQVRRVADYYRKFIKRFPDVFFLSRARWEDFFPYTRGLGYYNRGRNMLKTAKIIAKRYNGVFPKWKEELVKLPGIGEYTASAILSFGYKKNVLSFDTNLKKVFGRYLSGSKNARQNTEKIERELKTRRPLLNAAIMDFSSLVCTKNPLCRTCPLQSRCEYARTKGKKEKNIFSSKKFFPSASARVYLWLHKDHKIYYSPEPDFFQVFELSPLHNSRESIKKYFLKEYGLELSVRPPHRKVYISGIPTFFVNAQILLGTPEFGVFGRKEVMEFNSGLAEKISF